MPELRHEGALSCAAGADSMSRVLGRRRHEEDLRTFIREIARRHERASEEMIRRTGEEHARLMARFDATTVETVAELRALRAEVSGGRDEQRAQTQALLRLIDEMRGGGPEPAGA